MDTTGRMYRAEDSAAIPEDHTRLTELEYERLKKIKQEERHKELKKMRQAAAEAAQKGLSETKARLRTSMADRRKQGKKRN